jgi:hypothetical protein
MRRFPIALARLRVVCWATAVVLVVVAIVAVTRGQWVAMVQAGSVATVLAVVPVLVALAYESGYHDGRAAGWFDGGERVSWMPTAIRPARPVGDRRTSRFHPRLKRG